MMCVVWYMEQPKSLHAKAQGEAAPTFESRSRLAARDTMGTQQHYNKEI